MNNSTQDKVGRVRPPRIQISLGVHSDGATEAKELPFIVGVLGDFSGQPRPGSVPKFADRKFVDVTPENFDEVLDSMKPHLTLSVKDTLSADPDARRSVNLDFRSLDDFSPENVAKQVPALQELLELRKELANLRATLQTSPELEDGLEGLLSNDDRLAALRAELGLTEDQTNG